MKRLSFLLLFLISGNFTMAQSVKLVKDKKARIEYYVKADDPSVRHGKFIAYGQKKAIKLEGYYKNNEKDSLWIERSWDGRNTVSKGHYKNNQRIGVWEFYSYEGKLVQKINVETKEIQYSSETYTGSSKKVKIIKDGDTLEVEPDRMPTYEGGMTNFYRDMARIMRYPSPAVEKKRQGKVYVAMLIQKDGSVGDIFIKRSSNYTELDEEAIRVIKLLSKKWIPATYQGAAVDCIHIVPVNFKLG